MKNSYLELYPSSDINGCKVYFTVKVTVANPRGTSGVPIPIGQQYGATESTTTLSTGEVLVCASVLFAYIIMTSGTAGALLVYAPVVINGITKCPPSIIFR